MAKILPQADSLDKVIKIFRFVHNHEGCSYKDITVHIGFTERQSKYYTDACIYIGLLDNNNSLSFLGKTIMSDDESNIKPKIYECIISDVLINKIFAHVLLFRSDNQLKHAISFISIVFPGLSDAVYKRRAKCLIKWCETIIEYYNQTNLI